MSEIELVSVFFSSFFFFMVVVIYNRSGMDTMALEGRELVSRSAIV